MPSVEDQLADLRKQEEKYRTAAAKGEAQREAAVKGLQVAVKALADEFDVRPEDAPELLRKLQQEAEQEIAKAKTALAEAQG